MKINQMSEANNNPEIQKHNSFLARNIDVVKKLKANYSNIETIKKLFENLCVNCKRKAINNPQMDISEYCETCKIKIIPILEALKEKLEK